MTVSELIARLEEMPDNAEVMLLTQESWPLRFIVKGVVSSEELSQEPSDENDEESEGVESAENIVYIVEGGHPYNKSPYGDKDAWNICY